MAELLDLTAKTDDQLRGLYAEQKARMFGTRDIRKRDNQASAEYTGATVLKRIIGAELRRRNVPIQKGARPRSGRMIEMAVHGIAPSTEVFGLTLSTAQRRFVIQEAGRRKTDPVDAIRQMIEEKRKD